MKDSLYHCCYKKRMGWDVLQVSFGKMKQKKEFNYFYGLAAICEINAHCWAELGQNL